LTGGLDAIRRWYRRNFVPHSVESLQKIPELARLADAEVFVKNGQSAAKYFHVGAFTYSTLSYEKSVLSRIQVFTCSKPVTVVYGTASGASVMLGRGLSRSPKPPAARSCGSRQLFTTSSGTGCGFGVGAHLAVAPSGLKGWPSG